MPKIKELRNEKSLFANAIITSVVTELVQEIKKFLDRKNQLEFEHTVNRSYADDEISMIAKKHDKYLLITLNNGIASESYEFELDDWGNVSVYDLIWVIEQIELEEGVEPLFLVARKYLMFCIMLLCDQSSVLLPDLMPKASGI